MLNGKLSFDDKIPICAAIIEMKITTWVAKQEHKELEHDQ